MQEGRSAGGSAQEIVIVADGGKMRLDGSCCCRERGRWLSRRVFVGCG